MRLISQLRNKGGGAAVGEKGEGGAEEGGASPLFRTDTAGTASLLSGRQTDRRAGSDMMNFFFLFFPFLL